jgi:uridine monophosphate synthetase
MPQSTNKQECIRQLFNIGAIRFGEFTYSSGVKGNNYIDLRTIMSEPALLKTVADFIQQATTTCEYTLVSGVPFGALAFATAFGVMHDVPIIMPRKVEKMHGTRRMVEGIYQPGQVCLLIEDVCTTGKSCLETIAVLEREGIIIKDIVVVLDREQGGKAYLEQHGYRVHALFTLSQLFQTLIELNLIDAHAGYACAS